MGTGYTRADVSNNIADGNIINASDLDSEFDAVQAAFDAATGHTHDGTTAEGAPIEVTGPAQEYVSTNTEFRPKANNTYDLGSAANQWKDLYVDGTANLDAVDIDGGNIDGTTIGAATPAAGTFTTATATTGNITTVNATTVDTTNIEVTNIKAKDGTASATIADSTGVMTIASSVLTTADINGGTADNVVIGGATPAAGTFTTLTANGNVVLGDAATDTVTITADVASNIIPSADNTYDLGASGSEWKDLYIDGTANIDSLVADTADINGGTIDGTVIGGSTPAAISGTTGVFGSTITAGQTGTGNYILRKTGTLYGYNSVDGNNDVYVQTYSNADYRLLTNNAERLRVDGVTGDISFYEDTGTTPKFFWDASAESLGIGTSSPASTLSVRGSSGNSAVSFFGLAGSAISYIGSTAAGNYIIGAAANETFIRSDGVGIAFSANTGSSVQMRITSAGDVGIGTISPAQKLSVNGNAIILAGNEQMFAGPSNTNVGSIKAPDDSGALAIQTNSTERMRITSTGSVEWRPNGTTQAMTLDASGNLLVGKTTTGVAIVGAELNSAGLLRVARSGGAPIEANRTTSDGTIIDLRKDNTTVGSIGVNTDLTIDGASGETGLKFGNTGLIPRFSGADNDTNVSLGLSNRRFKDLYLSGGVYLGGTGAANLLDDYEEGTWTPVVADATTGGNLGSATISQASYTKIGRMVFLTAQLSDIDTTGMTAANILTIRNLPFVSSSDNFSVGSVKSDNLTFQGGRTNIYCQLQNSDDWLAFQVTGSAISETYIDVGDVVSGTTDISFSITYIT